MQVTRRQFLVGAGAVTGGLALSTLGVNVNPARAYAADLTKINKVLNAQETTSICCYCSCGCSVICSTGEDGKVFHIEGDPDHPINEGTLCPKGAAIKDFVNSDTRTKVPRYRAPGSDHWQEVSWDFALDKVARHIKDDRDANFVEKNAAGVTVNRWTSMGFLAASGGTNETGWLTYKTVRALGVLPFDNQARV